MLPLWVTSDKIAKNMSTSWPLTTMSTYPGINKSLNLIFGKTNMLLLGGKNTLVGFDLNKIKLGYVNILYWAKENNNLVNFREAKRSWRKRLFHAWQLQQIILAVLLLLAILTVQSNSWQPLPMISSLIWTYGRVVTVILSH